MTHDISRRAVRDSIIVRNFVDYFRGCRCSSCASDKMENNAFHLEGMLDRDQRTAKLRLCDRGVPKKLVNFSEIVSETNPNASVKSNSIINRSFPSRRRRTTNNSYLTWRNGYLLNTFKSLKSVLIVGVCLTLVTLPSTNSAPVSRKMSDLPMWINPCGLTVEQSKGASHNNGLNKGDLLKETLNQAKIALQKAVEFKEKFAQTTFGMKFDDVHDKFKDQKFEWLKTGIPKSLGEELAHEHLSGLELDETLLNAYSYLQTVAVGLEQVRIDQQEGKLQQEFTDTENNLKSVLCELQMALIERGLGGNRPDVMRDIMPDDYRHMNTTGTKTRDWIIFRDYMNVLEYVTQVVSHMSEA